jgi:hypothetical protein
MASASTTTCLHISLYFHDQFSLCEVSLGLRGALTPPQVLEQFSVVFTECFV